MKKKFAKCLALATGAAMLASVAGCSQMETSKSQEESEGSARNETQLAQETQGTQEASPETENEDVPNTEETDPVDVPVETENGSDSKVLNEEEQLQIIVANRSMWEIGVMGNPETTRYAVTDLNNDGVLELIAANTEGSMICTTADLYEVDVENSTLNHVASWGTNLETGEGTELEWFDYTYSWVIMDGNYVYAVNNKVSLGAEGEKEYWYRVTWGDDGISEELFAYSTAPQFSRDSSEIKYYDADDNEITKNDFESAKLCRNLQFYDDSDITYLEWFYMDGTYEFDDDFVYEYLSHSWSCFNLHASLG